jgi:hypothetical protein
MCSRAHPFPLLGSTMVRLSNGNSKPNAFEIPPCSHSYPSPFSCFPFGGFGVLEAWCIRKCITVSDWTIRDSYPTQSTSSFHLCNLTYSYLTCLF